MRTGEKQAALLKHLSGTSGRISIVKRASVYELGMKSFPSGRRLGKLSLNPEHDAAMSVRRPENDLVSGGSSQILASQAPRS
jgi:hypothetical protein